MLVDAPSQVGTFPRAANESYAAWMLYCGSFSPPEDMKLEKHEKLRAATPLLVRRASFDEGEKSSRNGKQDFEIVAPAPRHPLRCGVRGRGRSCC